LPGRLVGSDRQRADAQGLHDRPGGLAACNDEAADTEIAKADGDSPQQLFRHARRAPAAEAALDRSHRLRSRRGRDGDRTGSDPLGRPCDRLVGRARIIAGGGEIDPQDRPGSFEMLQLLGSAFGAAAGENRCRTMHRRQGRRRGSVDESLRSPQIRTATEEPPVMSGQSTLTAASILRSSSSAPSAIA